VLAQPSVLVAFLRRELAPFPGTAATATLRIAVACVAVLVLCMYRCACRRRTRGLGVFSRSALEESGETLLAGVGCPGALTIGIALALVLLLVAMDQPCLRFGSDRSSAALAFFLRRSVRDRRRGLRARADLRSRPDLAGISCRRPTGWSGSRSAWPVFALGIAAAVAANLCIAPHSPRGAAPANELVSRVRASRSGDRALLGAGRELARVDAVADAAARSGCCDWRATPASSIGAPRPQRAAARADRGDRSVATAGRHPRTCLQHRPLLPVLDDLEDALARIGQISQNPRASRRSSRPSRAPCAVRGGRVHEPEYVRHGSKARSR